VARIHLIHFTNRISEFLIHLKESRRTESKTKTRLITKVAE